MFIDSYRFSGSSLETLVDNLASDGGLKHFHRFRQTFPDSNVANMLLRKGTYCYVRLG